MFSTNIWFAPVPHSSQGFQGRGCLAGTEHCALTWGTLHTSLMPGRAWPGGCCPVPGRCSGPQISLSLGEVLKGDRLLSCTVAILSFGENTWTTIHLPYIWSWLWHGMMKRHATTRLNTSQFWQDVCCGLTHNQNKAAASVAREPIFVCSTSCSLK